MYLPLIGSFLEAVGTIIDKHNLNKTKINFKNYIVYGFFASVLVMLPLLAFFWRVDSGAFLPKNLIILGLVVFFAIIANLCINYSLKRENLTEMEPIRVMQPFFTILIAFIIFSEERNWLVILFGVIASIALVVAHVKKNHFVWNKYMVATLFGSFFFAVEMAISKFIIPYYSPITFYFFRCFFVFAVCLILFRPNLRELDKRTGGLILFSGLSWVLYRIILYMGYGSYGVILTTIIFILTPVLIMLYAVFLLKEKFSLKQAISAIVIIACVVGAILVQAGIL